MSPAFRFANTHFIRRKNERSSSNSGTHGPEEPCDKYKAFHFVLFHACVCVRSYPAGSAGAAAGARSALRSSHRDLTGGCTQRCCYQSVPPTTHDKSSFTVILRSPDICQVVWNQSEKWKNPAEIKMTENPCHLRRLHQLTKMPIVNRVCIHPFKGVCVCRAEAKLLFVWNWSASISKRQSDSRCKKFMYKNTICMWKQKRILCRTLIHFCV